MSTQINMSFPSDLLVQARKYAKTNGYINVQEFIRDLIREKVYDNLEVREEYLGTLNNKEATTFIPDEDADKLDRELEIQAKKL